MSPYRAWAFVASEDTRGNCPPLRSLSPFPVSQPSLTVVKILRNCNGSYSTGLSSLIYTADVHVEVSVRTSWYSRRIRPFHVHVNLYIIFFTIEKRPVASSLRYVAVATYAKG